MVALINVPRPIAGCELPCTDIALEVISVSSLLQTGEISLVLKESVNGKNCIVRVQQTQEIVLWLYLRNVVLTLAQKGFYRFQEDDWKVSYTDSPSVAEWLKGPA